MPTHPAAWARSTLLVLLAPIASLALADQAHACGWDWETYYAEQRSLPCVYDALLGYWPKHTDEYHRTRIEAADYALDWLPGWTPALDAKGISLLALGELEPADAVMKQRLALAPDAYPSHANLGTLYTFTGDYEAALEHIDRAMAIEPEAHFGREKYHRALVVFLSRTKADPAIASQENFLGITLTDAQRKAGSPREFEALGLEDDAFDALVSMISVYGADELPEIYLSLGELLAAHGERRLAYTAYRRAKELGHVRRDTLTRWNKAMNKEITAERPHPMRGGVGSYLDISNKYVIESKRAKEFQIEWSAWERERLAAGLAIWSDAGLTEIYAQMHAKRRRCDAPRIIADPLAPEAGEIVDASDSAEGIEP